MSRSQSQDITGEREHFQFMADAKNAAKGLIQNRQRAYQTTFRGPVAEVVLADLARFCRASETTFLPNDRAHAVLEGRREVWLRLMKYLHMTPEEIINMQRKDV